MNRMSRRRNFSSFRTRSQRARRNGRKNRRRTRGMIVRLHSRRPKIPQTDLRPLSFGAGGLSTTIRIVRPITIKIDTTKQDELTIGGVLDNITYKEIFQGYPKLRDHYNQIRIMSAKAVLTGQCGIDSKSMFAFGLLPFNYYTYSSPYKSFQALIDSGTIVLKHAYEENAAAWLPNVPGDYDYFEPDADIIESAALFYLAFFANFIPADFPVDDAECQLGIVTIDLNVVMRGRAQAGYAKVDTPIKAEVLSSTKPE